MRCYRLDDPDYQYRPWSAERRRAASERQKRRLARIALPEIIVLLEIRETLLVGLDRKLKKMPEWQSFRKLDAILMNGAAWKIRGMIAAPPPSN